METYLNQLLADVAHAVATVPWPFYESEEQDLWVWISREDELKSAPRKTLEEWTGISQDALPPHEMLDDLQLETLYAALREMLDAYHMPIVFHLTTPVRIQYQVLRRYFDQELPMLRWHMGFFDTCPDKKPYHECLLGDQCLCRFFKDLRDDDLSPEEERARALEIEVRHIQKKYGREWAKYYPYHLDPNYDDEEGNPYDDGFGNDDEADDDWWKR